MQPLHRLTPISGRAALLASACLIVPLTAKDPRGTAAANQRELDQRRIDIQEAEELLVQGDLAYQNHRFGDAVSAFAGARNLIPDAPVAAELRTAATRRLVQASIEQAKDLSRKGDMAKAMATIDAVLAPGVAPDDAAALSMRAQLEDPIHTNPALTKEHAAAVDEVRRLLYTAEGAYNLGKFDKAATLYQQVLHLDATNSAARRGMELVATAKADYGKAAKDQARAEMLNQVEAAWETAVPEPILGTGDLDPDAGMVDTPRLPVANKLDRIMIPSLILGDAGIEEAIELLRLRASEFDTLETDPAQRGVNITLQLGGPESELGNAIRATRINVRVNNVPLSQALRIITEQTKTVYNTDEYAVVIRPLGSDSKDLVTRAFRVPPNFITTLNSEASSAGSADPFAEKPSQGLVTERLGAREMLTKMGVKFPEGAAATLQGGTLTVTNTLDMMDLVSAIVDSVAQTEPVMVCIRVTQIRCQENRLKELGFDWMLENIGFGGAGWIPGTETLNFGGGTTGNGNRIGDIGLPSGQSTSNPITAGNRSGDSATYSDSIDGAIARNNSAPLSQYNTARGSGIFQISKLLDGSSAQMMIRGMAQKKGVDVMTTASTVTISGKAAIARSVREMYYARDYEPPEINSSTNGNSSGPGFATPSHPTDFGTREIGVVLEVTPTADPDRRHVEVAVNPTVVDFDGFVNYGSPINVPSTTPVIGLFNPLNSGAVEISANRVLEPVFSTSRLSTNVRVADGATIVLGGLLQDRINKVNDKTPIYGNLPLIGRLFESDVSQPISTAVIFLINVKLVDPTGQPYNER